MDDNVQPYPRPRVFCIMASGIPHRLPAANLPYLPGSSP